MRGNSRASRNERLGRGRGRSGHGDRARHSRSRSRDRAGGVRGRRNSPPARRREAEMFLENRERTRRDVRAQSRSPIRRREEDLAFMPNRYSPPSPGRHTYEKENPNFINRERQFSPHRLYSPERSRQFSPPRPSRQYSPPIPNRFSPTRSRPDHPQFSHEHHEYEQNQVHYIEPELNASLALQSRPDMLPWVGPEERWEDAPKEDKSMNTLFLSADEGHPLIPIFDGKDPSFTSRQFIQAIDSIGVKEGWIQSQKQFQMASKLAGAPKEWFIREDKLTENWDRLKKSFINTFPSEMDYFSNLQRMIARAKLDNESYSRYFTYKSMLLKACEITGRKAVSCLIGGLTVVNLRGDCYNKNFATPEELFAFLMEEEQIQQRQIAPTSGTVMVQTIPRAVEKPVTAPDTVRRCYRCNNSGHLYINCPQTVLLNSNIEGLAPKHIVDIIINGFTFQGFNDLNSQHLTIREDQAKSVRLLHNKQKKMIKAHKGKFTSTLGDISVVVRVGTVVVNMPIFVVPNNTQNAPVVIGDSLRTHADVHYFESSGGIVFQPKTVAPSNTSFSMNEKIIQKLNQDQQQAAPGDDFNGDGNANQRNRKRNRGRPEQAQSFEPRVAYKNYY